MTSETPPNTKTVPINETASSDSPYRIIDIPYPTTTTEKVVTFVRPIFYDKFRAKVNVISDKNRQNPVHKKDT